MDGEEIQASANSVMPSQQRREEIEVNFAAATALFTANYGEVLIRCTSVLHDMDLALEASQETFIQLSRYLQKRPTLNVDLGRLLAIAVTTARAVARREGTRKGAESWAAIVDDVELISGPFDSACDSELSAALAEAIAELPAGQRLFVVEFSRGSSARQCATNHGVVESTVAVQQSRAWRRLGRVLHRFSREQA